MPYLIIRHGVHDYATWKTVFDADGPTRASYGSRGGRVLRSAEDPSEVVALFEVDDLDRVREYVSSDELRVKMQEAGVSEQPDMYFLYEADAVDA